MIHAGASSEASRIAIATATDAWDLDEDGPLLVSALEDTGAEVRPEVWDADVDWSAYDLVVVRSTWDYVLRRDEFLAWAERVATATRLENPPEVIRWNTDKHYLSDLAAAGVSTVATTYFDAGASASGDAELLETLASVAVDGGDIVVKPTVSAGSNDTLRCGVDRLGDAVTQARSLLDVGRDVMVQPYLGAVDERGETAMVVIDGRPSHAIRKGPMLRGGIAEHDGLFVLEEIEPRRAEPDELELAAQVLDAATQLLGTGPLLYARVDVLRGDDGRPTLLELELTEPSFFLSHSPGAAERVASAVATRAAAARAGRSATR